MLLSGHMELLGGGDFIGLSRLAHLEQMWQSVWEHEGASRQDPAAFGHWEFSERLRKQMHMSWRWWEEDLPSGLHAGCLVFVATQGARTKLLAWDKTGEKDLHAKGQFCFLTSSFNLSHLLELTHSDVENYCFFVCVFRNLGCSDLNLCYFWHPPCKCRQMHLKVVAGLWALQSQQGLDMSHWALDIKLKWLREGIAFPNCISLKKCMFSGNFSLKGLARHTRVWLEGQSRAGLSLPLTSPAPCVQLVKFLASEHVNLSLRWQKLKCLP